MQPDCRPVCRTALGRTLELLVEPAARGYAERADELLQATAADGVNWVSAVRRARAAISPSPS